MPAGTAIAMLVETIALPRPGTVVSSELYRSYPAANVLPRVGALPFGPSICTCKAGGASLTARVLCCADAIDAETGVAFSLLANNAAYCCQLVVMIDYRVHLLAIEVTAGVGSMSFVFLWCGELGNEGGS